MTAVLAPVDARPTPRTPAGRVPAGPAWWGAVMGTGIVATLTELHAGHHAAGADLARFFVIVAWLLMLGLTAGFIARIVRDRSVWRESVSGVGAFAWGMVSMGVTSVGAATSAVVPAWYAPLARTAWLLDAALWTLGAVVGIASTAGFVAYILRRNPDGPRPAWGLAVVAPMVTATCGAPFVGQIDSDAASFALCAFLVCCFATSLVLGVVVFAVAYAHHFRVDPLPVAAAPSSWIPLGVVGQSTAAAQAISAQSARFLSPAAHDAAARFADVYGMVMLAVAVPLVAFAVVTTLRGARDRMPFSPGCWALTFPIGTLSLGSHHLAEATGLTVYSAAAVTAWIVLLGTWTLCATASLRSLLPTHV
ncbi:MAG: TDT family transporter [Gordonia sp. (in: high G+C Gram-positive bacteria)]